MAHFKAVVTHLGNQAILQAIGDLTRIQIVRAELGSGWFAGGDPAGMTGVLAPLEKIPMIGNKKVSDQTFLIPVQTTNEGITEPIFIREVAVYAQTNAGEICLAYCWSTDADDAVNTLSPAGSTTQNYDQVRIIDVNIYNASLDGADIEVKFSASALITWKDMVDYAAPVIHRHTADQIDESTGETTETAQRRQDEEIQALMAATGSGTIIVGAEDPRWVILSGYIDPVTGMLTSGGAW